MSNPAVLIGNPNPPGVAVAPGAPMPTYQALPGTSWNPPMGGTPAPQVVTKHTGEQANWFVASHHVARPWSNRFHEMLREGQIIFIARTANEEDELQTQVNSYQFNHMMREGYKRAMAILDPSNPLPMPEGIGMSRSEVRSIIFGTYPDVGAGGNPDDTVPGIGEAEIEEYLGRDTALEMEIPAGVYKERLKKAMILAKSQHFRYMWAPAISYRWNFWGVVNNTSVGTSPEGRVRATQSHRKFAPTVVVNCVVAKKVYVSNIWGHKNKVAEGNTVYLVLRRKTNGNGDYGAFEIVPDSYTNMEGIPSSETVYRDQAGYTRYGYVLPLGTCTEVADRPPAENKRLQAVGSRESSSVSVAHEALGALPKIVVQLRV